jgi:hypothetical protein
MDILCRGADRMRAELDRQLPLLDAHDVPLLVRISHLSHHRETRFSSTRPLSGRSSGVWATMRRTSEASRALVTSASTAAVACPAVPLRLDDGVADLDRPLVVDERATDLADDEVVLGAVEEEGTELARGADPCATPAENSVG